MKKLLLILSAATFFFACEKSDDDDTNPSAPEVKDIDFSNPQVGQVSRYLGFAAGCETINSFVFTGDTLVVEAVNTIEGLSFKESFTPGSPMADSAAAEYRVIKEDDHLLITERENSYLFFFFGNDTLKPQASPNTELDQMGCLFSHQNGEIFIGEEIGNLPSYTMGNISLTNQKVIACVPPFMNLSAYLIYTEDHLNLSQHLDQQMINPILRGYVRIN